MSKFEYFMQKTAVFKEKTETTPLQKSIAHLVILD